MGNIKKVFLGITIRSELFVTFVIVPFVIYFLAFGGRFQKDQIPYLVIGVVVGAYLPLSLHILVRFLLLKRMFRELEDPDSDKQNLKIRAFHYPFYEAIFSALRWLSGVSLLSAITSWKLDLTDINIYAFLMLPVFSIPYTAALLFFITENAMAPFLSDPRLSRQIISKNRVFVFSENMRKVFMIISVALLPAVLIGFFFVLSNNMGVHFQNLPLHFSFILFFTILAIIIPTHESARSTKRNISNLTSMINKIESGDLSIESIPMLSSSEIGFISQDLKSLIDKLSELVFTIQESAEKVASGSDQIKSSAEQISQGTAEQAASIEEISSSVEEMNSTVNMNSENAKKTSAIAAQASARAVDVKDAVSESIKSLRVILEKIRIVEDIAKETNMLALNAAIEAARAGSYGKGFSVVASEIRKLSDRTREASKKINELSVSNIEISEKTGGLLDNLVSGIRQTSELIQDISLSSDEQASGISQVNEAILQLNKAMQQNVAATEQLAASSVDFASESETLKQNADIFKISDSFAAAFGDEKHADSSPGRSIISESLKRPELELLFERFLEKEKDTITGEMEKNRQPETDEDKKENFQLNLNEDDSFNNF